ncbi:hypothetical protein [Oceanicaulis alexandrii]|uniref:hypothetical protein n=1 Tax=Oceanicaulis alexandrii TaxID=153233 RepID=UPI00235655BF|nr:hypothetical protein [Oceanicaulis alexandrii]
MALQTHRAPLAVVLALGLGLAACAPEAGQGDRAETRTRPVSEAQAQSALADFGLEEQGRASWSERRFERGAYIFTDFAMTLEDGRLTASELILTGPQRLEDQPFFTALEMQNAVIEAPDGELSTHVLSLVEPSETLARKIADLLRGEDSLGDLDEDRSGLGFARFEMAELAMQFEDTPSSALSLTLGAVVLEGFEEGETLQTGQLSALTLDGRDEQGGPLSLRLGEMQVSGVKLDGLDEGSPFGASLMSPDQAPYETLTLNDLLVSVGGIAITLPELTASVETLGSGVLSSQLNLPSLTLSPAPGHPQSADIVRSFDMLGYDQLELSASGESRYDPETDRAWTEDENIIRLVDGLTLSFEQDVSGLSAYAEQAEGLTADKPGATPDPAQLMAPLMIHRFRLQLTDESLMERITSQIAQSSGVSEQQARVQLGAMSRMGLAFAGAQLPAGLVDQAGPALDRFISSGGVLTLEMNPEAPVSAAAFAAYPAPDAQTLGLRITHEGGDAPAPK